MRLLVILCAGGTHAALRPSNGSWEVYDGGDYEDIIITTGNTPEEAIERAYELRVMPKMTYTI